MEVDQHPMHMYADVQPPPVEVANSPQPPDGDIYPTPLAICLPPKTHQLPRSQISSHFIPAVAAAQSDVASVRFFLYQNNRPSSSFPHVCDREDTTNHDAHCNSSISLVGFFTHRLFTDQTPARRTLTKQCKKPTMKLCVSAQRGGCLSSFLTAPPIRNFSRTGNTAFDFGHILSR